MTDPASAIWVHDRSGQVVPFEADRICQSLFAATEELGHPDVFLARELTDGVVHFLCEEANGTPPKIDELPELVAKVVRELGQPALARKFEELGRRPKPAPVRETVPDAWRQLIASTPPPDVLARFAVSERLTALSLSEVFPKNLGAAHGEGLLTLGGLDHPLELTGSVLGPGERLLESLQRDREHTGGLVAIDSPEYALAAQFGKPAELAAKYVRELGEALRATGLAAVVNLNIATPPTWGRDLGIGPLFAEVRQEVDPQRAAALAAALCDEIATQAQDPATRIEIAWHLSAADFGKEKKDVIARLAACDFDAVPITFHLDRPRRPVSLAPGLGRNHPALLMAVGVNLPQLAQQISPITTDRFLSKIGTLARLARSAGHAKQDFLRRHSRPAVTRGFLLDRARLIVIPIGLESVVRSLTGHGICETTSSEEFARQILAKLREALAHEKPRTMDAGLDSQPPFCPASDSKSNNWEGVGGLPTRDSESTPQMQLRAAGSLQSVADGGTVVVALAESEALGMLLKYAWTQTDVGRVRFVGSK